MLGGFLVSLKGKILVRFRFPFTIKSTVKVKAIVGPALRRLAVSSISANIRFNILNTEVLLKITLLVIWILLFTVSTT